MPGICLEAAWKLCSAVGAGAGAHTHMQTRTHTHADTHTHTHTQADAAEARQRLSDAEAEAAYARERAEAQADDDVGRQQVRGCSRALTPTLRSLHSLPHPTLPDTLCHAPSLPYPPHPTLSDYESLVHACTHITRAPVSRFQLVQLLVEVVMLRAVNEELNDAHAGADAAAARMAQELSRVQGEAARMAQELGRVQVCAFVCVCVCVCILPCSYLQLPCSYHAATMQLPCN
jgi:hypothetical protein